MFSATAFSLLALLLLPALAAPTSSPSAPGACRFSCAHRDNHGNPLVPHHDAINDGRTFTCIYQAPHHGLTEIPAKRAVAPSPAHGHIVGFGASPEGGSDGAHGSPGGPDWRRKRAPNGHGPPDGGPDWRKRDVSTYIGQPATCEYDLKTGESLRNSGGRCPEPEKNCEPEESAGESS